MSRSCWVTRTYGCCAPFLAFFELLKGEPVQIGM